MLSAESKEDSTIQESKEDSVDDSPVQESKEDYDDNSQTPSASEWQAIWAPQYNAYYFFNPSTQESTWSNPLQPDTSDPATTTTTTPPDVDDPSAAPSDPPMSAAAAHNAALQAAALAQGIDPLLAHLDPSLLSTPGASTSAPSALPTFKAQFNARTGAFAPATSRTPGHLSEHERAKRMSEFYFDVGKWEEDLARRGGRLMAEEGEGAEGEGGKKRKRPSKKDIERFKEQKKQKKIAKTAWLRT